MNNGNSKIIFIFDSTRSVIRAEKICRNAGLDIKIIPVPRSISPKCGMALEIDMKLEKDIRRLLLENDLNAETIERKDITL